MPITPRNLIGHELIGLPVEVVSSEDPGLKGRKGTVVDETERLLVVETRDRREIKMPKKGVIFRFFLQKDGKGLPPSQVDVEGWTIISKPEERTKRLGSALRAWRRRRRPLPQQK